MLMLKSVLDLLLTLLILDDNVLDLQQNKKKENQNIFFHLHPISKPPLLLLKLQVKDRNHEHHISFLSLNGILNYFDLL